MIDSPPHQPGPHASATRLRASVVVESAARGHDVYRAAFFELAAVSFLTDCRAVIIEANRAASLFLNVPVRALVAKPILHFVARGDVREFRRRVNNNRSETIGPLPVKLRPRKGHPQPMTMTAASLGIRDRFVWVALPVAFAGAGEQVEEAGEQAEAG